MRQRNSKIKKKDVLPLTHRILVSIFTKAEDARRRFVDIIDAMSIYPHTFNPMRIEELHARRDYWERKQLQRALRDLKQRKLITTQKVGKRLLHALTNEGCVRSLRFSARNASLCSPDECVIVIFDIPESVRRVRLLFRRFLRECHFQQLQRSVWVSERAVLPEIQRFITLHNIAHWVRAFIARDALLPQERSNNNQKKNKSIKNRRNVL